MARQSIITGLDIGTGNIKILVASFKNGEENLEVIAQTQETSFGVRKGVIIDCEKVSRIIQILLNKVRW